MANSYKPRGEMTAEEIWTVQPGERRSVGRDPHRYHRSVDRYRFCGRRVWQHSIPTWFRCQFLLDRHRRPAGWAIWFGAWGVLAGAIFPFFSNAVAGTPFYVSIAYIPANAVQAFLPAWAFRRFKADPRLRSGRDYLILLAAMVISSAFGALWSPLVVLRGFGLLTAESVPLFVWGWFGGNVVAGIVFNFILLKALSSVVIRTPAFVKRWWA
jgi:hypothetical protein